MLRKDHSLFSSFFTTFVLLGSTFCLSDVDDLWNPISWFSLAKFVMVVLSHKSKQQIPHVQSVMKYIYKYIAHTNSQGYRQNILTKVVLMIKLRSQ